MSDFREQGFEVFGTWSAAVEKFNVRPGGQYGPGINAGSGTRLSPTEGKPEYTFVEAQLHHLGRVIAIARIDMNFEDNSFEVTHADKTREHVFGESIDVPALVERIIGELTNKVER